MHLLKSTNAMYGNAVMVLARQGWLLWTAVSTSQRIVPICLPSSARTRDPKPNSDGYQVSLRHGGSPNFEALVNFKNRVEHCSVYKSADPPLRYLSEKQQCRWDQNVGMAVYDSGETTISTYSTLACPRPTKYGRRRTRNRGRGRTHTRTSRT